MTNPEPQAPARDRTPVGNPNAVIAAGVATAVLCLFPWYDFSAGGAFASQVRDAAQAFGQTTAIKGVSTALGILCLLAALGGAAVTWAESSGTLSADRGSLLLGAAASSAAAVVFGICGLVAGPSGFGAQFWLYLAIAAAGSATWFAFQRLQEFKLTSAVNAEE